MKIARLLSTSTRKAGHTPRLPPPTRDVAAEVPRPRLHDTSSLVARENAARIRFPQRDATAAVREGRDDCAPLRAPRGRRNAAATSHTPRLSTRAAAALAREQHIPQAAASTPSSLHRSPPSRPSGRSPAGRASNGPTPPRTSWPCAARSRARRRTRTRRPRSCSRLWTCAPIPAATRAPTAPWIPCKRRPWLLN